MKHLSQRLFSIALLSLTLLMSTSHLFANTCNSCGTSSCCGTSDNVLPYLSFRSAGRDSVRKLVGTTSYAVWQYDKDSYYGTFELIPAYERSMKSKEIAECLFGCDLQRGVSGDCSTNCDDGRIVKVSGSQVVGRAANTNDWMAENFYLSRNFQSTLEFKPLIQNIILDFHLYVGLDQWAKGLYFRLYGPVVNARYNLNFCEKDPTVGNVGYQEGFFNETLTDGDSQENAVPVANLLQNAASFFSGGTPNVDGVTTNGLQFAKICSGQQTNTCFGDLRFELGWNPLLEENYLFGFGIEFAAPTGRRPDACFLFEPQCGNGKHWELGGNVHALWRIWSSEDEEQHWDLVIDADITHLFNAKQRRTFDLNGKPLSRYMLAQKMGTPIQNLQGRDTVGQGNEGISTPNQQFQKEYAPVANFSTRDIKVSAAVQADLVAMLDFTINGFSWDVGYNFWARSCEKIEFRDDCDSSCGSTSFPANTWALKGDAYAVGFAGGDDVNPTITSGMPIPLSATESNATIHTGTNIPNSSTNSADNTMAGTSDNRNPGIDNPKFAVTSGDGKVRILFADQNLLNVNLNQTRTSIQPVLISQSDLNCNARSRGISHKVFTHFNYTWINQENWTPYLGVGASAEFGKTDSNSCCSTTSSSSTSTNNSCCTNCALSKWALWLKLGVSY
jgi:hypothetical protein